MSKAPWVRWFTTNWVAATAHLGPLEEGIYSKLIHHYYLSRKPLPAEIDRLCTIARATEPASRRAVEEIATEYFYLAEDPEYGPVLRHHRADEEIAYSDSKHLEAITKGTKTAWIRYGREEDRVQLEALGVEVPMRSSTTSPTGSSTTPQLVENQNQNKIKEIPPLPPKGGDPPKRRKSADTQPPDDFAAFWAVYPKKVAKPAAVKAWKHISTANRAAAMAHLQGKPYADREPQYIPNPSTYLNNERWADQMPTGKSTDPTPSYAKSKPLGA